MPFNSEPKFPNRRAYVLKLRSDALNRIRFVTYTREVRGKIECGQRSSAQPVLVTYRPASGDMPASDGELTAVEFVPEEWLH